MSESNNGVTRIGRGAEISLKFWTLFVGIGAVVGALMMWIDPSGKMWGMEQLLPTLHVLPFRDLLFRNFIFSGFVLLFVNGVTQFFAAALLFHHDKYAGAVCLLCGVILMMWIVLEWVLWGFQTLSNVYFVFGALEALTAVVKILLDRKASAEI